MDDFLLHTRSKMFILSMYCTELYGIFWIFFGSIRYGIRGNMGSGRGIGDGDRGGRVWKRWNKWLLIVNGICNLSQRITETAAIVSWWLEIIESWGTAAAVGAAKIFQPQAAGRIPKTVAVSRLLEIIESLGTAAAVAAAAAVWQSFLATGSRKGTNYSRRV